MRGKGLNSKRDVCMSIFNLRQAAVGEAGTERIKGQ